MRSCATSPRPLQGQDLGDGVVYRTIARVQKRYYDPPISTGGPRREW
jgi:hypothetical protein